MFIAPCAAHTEVHIALGICTERRDDTHASRGVNSSFAIRFSAFICWPGLWSSPYFFGGEITRNRGTPGKVIPGTLLVGDISVYKFSRRVVQMLLVACRDPLGLYELYVTGARIRAARYDTMSLTLIVSSCIFASQAKPFENKHVHRWCPRETQAKVFQNQCMAKLSLLLQTTPQQRRSRLRAFAKKCATAGSRGKDPHDEAFRVRKRVDLPWADGSSPLETNNPMICLGRTPQRFRI